MNRLHETNGKPKSTPKPKSTEKKKTTRKASKATVLKHRIQTFRTIVTIALGIAIPALSLTLSHIAGSLGRHSFPYLAVFAGACGVAVLTVSLSHLAEAIREITGAQPWQSWLLAITLDLSIIASELIQVYAHEAGLHDWCRGLMVVVAIFSMALNCYAFLACRSK